MTQILLLIYGVISCDIAKGGALRERGNVRTSGGAASSAGKILPIMNLGFKIEKAKHKTMNEDKDKIAIIGSGPISVLAAQMIQDKTGKEVIVIDNVFSNNSIIIKPYHVPEILKPSEPTNRSTRRKKLRMKHKRK